MDRKEVRIAAPLSVAEREAAEMFWQRNADAGLVKRRISIAQVCWFGLLAAILVFFLWGSFTNP